MAALTPRAPSSACTGVGTARTLRLQGGLGAVQRRRPLGQPVDFVTGFLKDDQARGRTVGVVFDPSKRVLLVADDLSNTIWRIALSR